MDKNITERLAQLSPEEQRELLAQLLRKRATPAKVAPLSFAQERFWFLTQLDPDNPTYTMFGGVRIDGLLDVAVLRRCIGEIVRRHEVLRTSFAQQEHQPVQVIAPFQPPDLPLTDLAGLPEELREAEAMRLVTRDIHPKIDINRGPIFYANLIRTGSRRHYLAVTVHHIAADGWSMDVFMRELAALYPAFLSQGESPLPELPLQFADVAAWQRQRLQGRRLEQLLDYWRQHLGGQLPALELPADRPRPLFQSASGDTYRFGISAERTQALQAFSRQAGATLFATLLAAFQALLYRYTGQLTIVTGLPVAGRNRSEFEQLVGPFINTLVLRSDLSDSLSFRELLQQVRLSALGALEHQELPFEKLVAELQPQRDLSRNPLFQVLFALQQVPEPVELPGLQLSILDPERKTTKVDLSLSFVETAAGLKGLIEYSTDLFDGGRIARMAEHLQVLLEAAVQRPDERLAYLPLLTARERQQLLVDWNQTQAPYPADRSFPDLFEAQAARTPAEIALIDGETRLTYAELNGRASQLARTLQHRGVGPETLVGVCMQRSAALIVGLLGILKAGAAYVPIDPAYPPDRQTYILHDAGITVLLADPVSAAGLSEPQAQVITLDSGWAAIASADSSDPPRALHPHNLAYVIYTSGSTGLPKGVLVEHGGLVNMVTSFSTSYSLGVGDRVLQQTSICFDASISELFPVLCSGGTLVLYDAPKVMDSEQLIDFIARHQITILGAVPSLLRLINQRMCDLPALRLVASGGDELTLEDVDQLARQAIVTNGYGPTEITVCASYHQLDLAAMQQKQASLAQQAGGRRKTSIAIGRPLINTEIYLLDPQLQPVPIGVPGEICVGGVGVTRGYQRRPALTAERYIPHPFSPLPGARLYRTGDMAFYQPDGTLEFLGRKDEQVKIRGNRIEIGEIETVLAQHPAVAQAVVAACEDSDGQRRLMAYLVARGTTLPARSELRRHLLEKLPEYMLPAGYSWLDALPHTPNGKVDRRALPAPQFNAEHEHDFAAPRTPTETLLAQIWAETLGLPRVGRSDNFFELGGDSMLMMVAINKGRQAGHQITPKQMLQHQTVAELAQTLGEQAAAPAAAPALAEPEPVVGPAPRLPRYHAFFEGDAHAVERHNYADNPVLLLEARSPLQPALLEQALRQLMRHHDSLRLRMVLEHGEWLLVFAPPEEHVPLAHQDLAALPAAEQPAAISAAIAHFRASLHLTDGPVLRVVLFELGGGQPQQILLIFHHLAADFISVGVLLEDLQSAYQQLAGGQSVRLPPKTSSLKQAGETMLAYVRSEEAQRSLEHWLSRPWGHFAQLPLDYPEQLGTDTIATTRLHTAALTAEETETLRRVCAKADVQIVDVYITGLVVALARWTGGNIQLLELIQHGRAPVFPELDLARTTGWLSMHTPMFIQLDQTSGPRDVLRAVAAELRELPARGTQYELLRYLSSDRQVIEQLMWLPRPELLVNYAGQVERPIASSELFRPAHLPSGAGRNEQNIRYKLLEARARIHEQRFEIIWNYSERLYRADTIEALAATCTATMRGLIQDLAASGDSAPATPQPHPQGDRAPATDSRPAAADPPAHSGVAEQVPLTTDQSWFLQQPIKEPQRWNVAALFELPEPIDAVPLERAVKAVVAHHAALRARFTHTAAGWRQTLAAPDPAAPFAMVDLSGVPAAQQADALAAACEDVQGSLDLAGGLLRVVLFRLGGGQPGRLLIVAHHLVVDQTSLAIVLEDLLASYQQLRRGLTVRLPATTSPFAQWATRLAAYANTAVLTRELDYWLSRPHRQVPPLPLDMPDGREHNTVRSCRQVQVELSAEETQALLRLPQRHQVLLTDALLLALVTALTQWTGARWTELTVVSGGRDALPDAHDLDVSRTVGWFAMSRLLFLARPEQRDPLAALQALQQQIEAIPQRGYGFCLLRYLCADPLVAQQLAPVRKEEVLFNYLGQIDRLKSASLRRASEPTGWHSHPENRRFTLLDVVAAIDDDRLKIKWVYSQHAHRQATIERVAQDFLTTLRSLAALCRAS